MLVEVSTANEVRRRITAGETQSAVARALGVSRQRIHQIVRHLGLRPVKSRAGRPGPTKEQRAQIWGLHHGGVGTCEIARRIGLHRDVVGRVLRADVRTRIADLRARLVKIAGELGGEDGRSIERALEHLDEVGATGRRRTDADLLDNLERYVAEEGDVEIQADSGRVAIWDSGITGRVHTGVDLRAALGVLSVGLEATS